MTAAPPVAETWMPNGFPPPSFVVETERSTTFAGTTFASHRGRWLAAAAILGALLLITGILLIARDDPKTDVATSSSTTTTAFGDTTPTFPASTALDPTATIPDANTVPGGGAGVPVDPGVGTVPSNGGAGGAGTTVAPGGTPNPGGGPGAGTLSTSATTVSLGRVDSGAGPASAKLILNNTGGSPLSFTAASEFPGALTVSPGSGNIGAGAGAEVTITLDGAKVREGGFTGALGFTANGATRKVTVTATVGRPPLILDNVGEPCDQGVTPCSKQILLVDPGGNETPCTSKWSYSVNVQDDSDLKRVVADATQKVGNNGPTDIDVVLKNNGATSGPDGVWRSDIFDQLPAGTSITFTIEAVDQFDFVRRGTPQTVSC